MYGAAFLAGGRMPGIAQCHEPSRAQGRWRSRPTLKSRKSRTGSPNTQAPSWPTAYLPPADGSGDCLMIVPLEHKNAAIWAVRQNYSNGREYLGRPSVALIKSCRVCPVRASMRVVAVESQQNSDPPSGENTSDVTLP
jgi:hypothetical protein